MGFLCVAVSLVTSPRVVFCLFVGVALCLCVAFVLLLLRHCLLHCCCVRPSCFCYVCVATTCHIATNSPCGTHASCELRLYTSYKIDESYTPSCISVRIGTAQHDLQEIQVVDLK